jgi:hypothetical protein
MLLNFLPLKIKKREQENKNKMKNKTARLLEIAIVLLAVFLLMPQVKAAAVDLGLTYASATGLPGQDIRIIISNIIRVALGLLGVVAVSLMIFGGYNWMTAAGNPEKVDKAKKILINAAIGLYHCLIYYRCYYRQFRQWGWRRSYAIWRWRRRFRQWHYSKSLSSA